LTHVCFAAQIARPLLESLESNVPLVLGAILALVLVGARATSRDATFRADLRGAVFFLFAFLGLRTLWWVGKDHLPAGTGRMLLVAWMLCFAFGCIRAGVSFALRLLRFSTRSTPKILRDVIDFTLYAFAAVPILKSQLDIDVTGLLATSAIVSVVIGLALQDTLGNLFAGLSIQLERPFQVGDYVTIKEHTGRIVQIAWRATRLETFRRELVTLPNNTLSKEAIRNYSRGGEPLAIDIDIIAGFNAPPNRVKAALLETLHDLPFVLRAPAAACRAMQFDATGIRYRVRCFIPDFVHADAVIDEFHTRAWYCFRREGIEIPVPPLDASTRTARPRSRTDADVAALLAAVDLFALLSSEELASLAAELVPRPYGKGERVIEQGREGHAFYLVASGEVSVQAGAPPAEVARLKRGEYFGEMSLLTGEPRSATVVVTEDAMLLEIDRDTFARLFEMHPGLAKQLSSLLARRRSELRALAEANAVTDSAPDAGRIFSRLRQIFGLIDD
jgi:small-conductance mechanosensitive channel/CRP-like cAMP-binding protein